MDLDIALLVGQDGIASGAIYAMMALGMVLIFNSTRIIFVPFGDLVAYAALTLGYLQLNQRPGTIWLVAVLAVLAFAVEAISLLWRRKADELGRAVVIWLILPLAPVFAAALMGGHEMSWSVQLLLS